TPAKGPKLPRQRRVKPSTMATARRKTIRRGPDGCSQWQSTACRMQASGYENRMTTAAKKQKKRRKLPWYLRPFKWLLWFIALSILWVLVYAVVPPPVTFTMLADRNGITKDWESLSNIDRNMVRAVIAAEDGKFCSHNGFDREAIEEAIERNAKGKKLRGGSTISQQTAKNVFLWQGSGWTRY